MQVLAKGEDITSSPKILYRSEGKQFSDTLWILCIINTHKYNNKHIFMRLLHGEKLLSESESFCG